MSGRKRKLPKVGIVKWYDAWSNDSDQYNKKALKKVIGYTRRTAGFIVRNDNCGVIVMRHWESELCCEGMTFIPKGMVICVTYLKEKKNVG